MQTAPEKSLLSLIPDPDSLGRPEKSPEENLQIKTCFTLNLSVSAGIIRDCSCMYSAGTAGHRGTCKAWLVTVYDLAKLGYIFTYLEKSHSQDTEVLAQYLPATCTAAPEQGTQVVLKVFGITNVNTTNYF